VLVDTEIGLTSELTVELQANWKPASYEKSNCNPYGSQLSDYFAINELVYTSENKVLYRYSYINIIYSRMTRLISILLDK